MFSNRLRHRVMRCVASISRQTNSRLFQEDINLLYDGKCNLCLREINFLAARDKQGKIKFTDIESNLFDSSLPENGGVDYATGMRVLHAVTAEGEVVRGVEVIRRIYAAVGLGWLFSFTRLPFIGRIADEAYEVWAGFRTNVTRGENVDDIILKRNMDLKSKLTCSDDTSCERFMDAKLSHLELMQALEDTDIIVDDTPPVPTNGSEPKIFIIGAARSGTTSLLKLLSTRKNICAPINLGVDFFGIDDAFRRGRFHYDGLFESCNATFDIVDCTSTRFSNPIVPDRMKAVFGKKSLSMKKLIILLREPVSREFSVYSTLIDKCMLHMYDYLVDRGPIPSQGWTVDELCRNENCNRLHCTSTAKYADKANLRQSLVSFRDYYTRGYLNLTDSSYLDHLKHYLKYFKRRQIMVINFHRIVQDTPQHMLRIAKFLNIKQGWGRSIEYPRPSKYERSTSGIHPHMDCETRNALANYFKGRNKDLYRFIRKTARKANQLEAPFGVFPDPMSNISCGSEKTGGPKYFIIGAQKAGTTSLHSLLAEHPDICTQHKATNFFSRDRLYSLGVEAYLDYFSGCDDPRKAALESTPNYLVDPRVPARMNATMNLSHRRLIVILRNPVDREYSYYKFLMNQCMTYLDLQLQRIIETESSGWNNTIFMRNRYCRRLNITSSPRLHSVTRDNILPALPTFHEYHDSGSLILRDSIYIDQIKLYLQFFNRSQMMIINFDYMLTHTQDLAGRLEAFLGVAPYWSLVNGNGVGNGTGELVTETSTSTSYALYHGGMPKNPTVVLDHEGGDDIESRLDCDTRDKLTIAFATHNSRLFKFLAEDSVGAHPSEPYFNPFTETKCEK